MLETLEMLETVETLETQTRLHQTPFTGPCSALGCFLEHPV